MNEREQTTEEQSVKDILRWYFSPYLTTLITAPMFLILIITGVTMTLGVIGRAISFIVEWPWLLLIGPVGLPLQSLHLFGIYAAIVGIPQVWANEEHSAVGRIIRIAAYFFGALLFGAIWNNLQVVLGRWMLGIRR